MNNILNFLRIPLVKFTGILLILYFALFSNDHNPDSLSNRLSKEKINEGLNQAAEKSRLIISTVNKIPKAPQSNIEQPVETVQLSTENIEKGEGEDVVSCGSVVEISYGIYKSNNQQLRSVSLEKLTIGSNIEKIIEENITGMKRGGIRNIIIPYNFQSDDRVLKGMLDFHKSDLRYQISLLSLSNPTNPISCE